MKNIEEIITLLDLVYYEFNENKNCFYVDSIWSKTYIYKEFIKITFTLSKYNYKFLVKKDRSITITKYGNFISKVVDFRQNILDFFKRKKTSIYLLNNTNHPYVRNIPLFQIELIKKELDLNSYEALVFTSKNAVYSINELNCLWKKIPSYAISSNTAKSIEVLGGKLAFVGNKKNGNSFVEDLIPKLKGKKVLYLRGMDILTDVKRILQNNTIICEEEIIYETKLNNDIKNIKLKNNSVIIFTAPSNVKFFFKLFKGNMNFKAVAIGEKTANYIPKDIETHIASYLSIESCINKAIKIS